MKTRVTSFMDDSFVLALNSGDRDGSYVWLSMLFTERDLVVLKKQIDDALADAKARRRFRF